MKRIRIRAVLDHAIAAFFGLFLSFPVFLVIASSLKSQKDIFSRTPVILFAPRIENYIDVFTRSNNFLRSIGNSLSITLGSVALALAISMPVAYAYSRLASRKIQQTGVFLIGLRMFPPILVSVPLVPLLTSVNLMDKPIVLVLIHAAFQTAMTVMLLKVFIDAIPEELDEAAMLDGCGRLTIFLRIMLPMIGPGLFACTIFITLASWNDYLFAFLFTSFSSRTTPIVIAEMLNEVDNNNISWGVLFAACTLQALPVMAFMWSVQGRLLSTFSLGSVKE